MAYHLHMLQNFHSCYFGVHDSHMEYLLIKYTIERVFKSMTYRDQSVAQQVRALWYTDINSWEPQHTKEKVRHGCTCLQPQHWWVKRQSGHWGLLVSQFSRETVISSLNERSHLMGIRQRALEEDIHHLPLTSTQAPVLVKPAKWVTGSLQAQVVTQATSICMQARQTSSQHLWRIPGSGSTASVLWKMKGHPSWLSLHQHARTITEHFLHVISSSLATGCR